MSHTDECPIGLPHCELCIDGMYEPKRKAKRPSWGDPGSRVTRRTNARVFSRGWRPVVVTVYPDGVIGLRLSKERREEFVNAADAYRQAVLLRKALERDAKRKARKGQ